MGSIEITDGGYLRTAPAKVGGCVGEACSSVVVSGKGSIWANDTELYVNDDGYVKVKDGARIDSRGAIYVALSGNVYVGKDGFLAAYGSRLGKQRGNANAARIVTKGTFQVDSGGELLSDGHIIVSGGVLKIAHYGKVSKPRVERGGGIEEDAEVTEPVIPGAKPNIEIEGDGKVSLDGKAELRRMDIGRGGGVVEAALLEGGGGTLYVDEGLYVNRIIRASDASSVLYVNGETTFSAPGELGVWLDPATVLGPSVGSGKMRGTSVIEASGDVELSGVLRVDENVEGLSELAIDDAFSVLRIPVTDGDLGGTFDLVDTPDLSGYKKLIAAYDTADNGTFPGTGYNVGGSNGMREVVLQVVNLTYYPTDIVLNDFRGNLNGSFAIDYDVDNNGATGFYVGIYAVDAEGRPYEQLMTHWFDSSYGTYGTHNNVEIPVTTSLDIKGRRLMAVIDPQRNLDEAVAANNRRLMSPSAVQDTAGNVHAFGDGANDYFDVSYGGTANSVSFGPSVTFTDVNQVYIYGYGGGDSVGIDSDVTVPFVIYGGDGNDTIWGGKGDDVIYGEDGDDRLLGDPIECGGACRGSDTIYGGEGDDTITGAGGGDSVATGNDNDVLYGEGGDDWLEGQAGDDFLDGGSGADRYIFFTGVDTDLGKNALVDDGVAENWLDFGYFDTTTAATGISLNLSDDNKLGQTLVDVGSYYLALQLSDSTSIKKVTGTPYSDTIIGNDADNIFVAGLGSDTLKGGLGDDTYVLASLGVSYDEDELFELSDEGDDTIDLSGVTAGVTFSLASTDQQTLNASLKVRLTGANFENAIGTGVADTITGNALANRLEGGGGDDTLIGGDGDDVYVFAQSADTTDMGTDTITEVADEGDDTLDFSGAKGRVQVNLGTTNLQPYVLQSGTPPSTVSRLGLYLPSGDVVENVIGTSFADIITGNSASNTVHLIGGSDTVDGANGDDYYIFEDVPVGQTASVAVTDLGGTDTLDFRRLSEGVVVNVANTGSATTSRLTFAGTTGSVFENVVGSEFDDDITGNTSDNVLAGGSGSDVYRFVRTGSESLGSDSIVDFSVGDFDAISFAAMNTAIAIDLARTDEQEVAGQVGDILKLVLSSENGIENVIGTEFDDWIIGNDLANRIEGGFGDDTLEGGAGDDVYPFVLSSGSDDLGEDTIVEVDAADMDTLDFAGISYVSSPAVVVDLLDTMTQQVHTKLTLTLSSPSGIENVIGTEYSDTIKGNARPNRLEGGLGDDTLEGQRGDDVYVFDRDTEDLGYDTIREFGYIDKDTLDFSGAQNARLEINLSNSAWQSYSAEYGQLLESDGESGWNTVAEFDLEVIGAGAGTGIEGVIGSPGGDLIVGNSRPNVLEGRAGDDTLVGGLGDDVYVYARLEDESQTLGNDEIQEAVGYGYDTIDFSGMSYGIAINIGDKNTLQDVVPGELGIDIASAYGDSLAGGDSIEHVIGGPRDDEIRGNSLANHLRGGNGDDTVEGWGGNDILDGGVGSDTYEFHYDSMVGALGDDLLREGEAADSDTLDFSEFPSGVGVDLGSGASAYGIFTLLFDRGDGVENVIGTDYNDTLIGNARANVLVGGAGGDSLHGLDGDDTLEAGEGSDSLAGGAGNDVYRFVRALSQDLGYVSISEAADIDTDTLDFSQFDVSSGGISLRLYETTTWTVYSGGLFLTLSSDSGIENVIGSPGADSIDGNNRPNVLEGREGNDTLAGIAGEDTYVFARIDQENLGSDTINEQTAYDAFDTIDLSGVGVAVNVNATEGEVSGVFDFTVMSGTIEKLIGGDFDDMLWGDGVWLDGGRGNDTLYGSSSGDTLEGGEGDDLLVGGTGNDVYRFRRPQLEDLGVDRVFEESGEGSDWLDFKEFDEAVVLDLAVASQQTISDGILELILLLDDDTSLSSIENASGGSFDDILRGNAFANHLQGSLGNDTLEGRGGDDSLEGGNGNDNYQFPQIGTEDLGDDTIVEDDYRDLDTLDFSQFGSRILIDLTDGAQNVDPVNNKLSLDIGSTYFAIEGVIGTKYDDSISGNPRPNVFEGGEGNDTLGGGDGDDRYVFNVTGTTSLGEDLIESEAEFGGRDILDFGGFQPDSGGIEIDLGVSPQQQQIVHSQLKITLAVSAGSVVEIEGVIGTSSDDIISGNDLDNLLIGNGGNDEINGGDGDDVLAGDGGDDSLAGGAGDDIYMFDRTIVADLGHDTITESANADNDALHFGLFGDGIAIALADESPQTVHASLTLTLSTESGIEQVVGTPFSDGIAGNTRDNVLDGGDGDDVYSFDRDTPTADLGDDTILDSGGNDTLDFQGFLEAVNVNASSGGTLAANSDLTLTLPAAALETVIGSTGNDTIVGAAGGLVDGGFGNDSLTAGGDDVTLIGSYGDDGLVGIGKRTTLEGGRGDDEYYGGGGDTTYKFSGPMDSMGLGDDTVYGEANDQGTDVLDFSDLDVGVVVGLGTDSLQAVAGGDLHLTLNGTRVIENALGTANGDYIYGNDRPNVIWGGDGADVITGGLGDDTIYGEAGNDSLSGNDDNDDLDGGEGNDSLTGGTGSDEYLFSQTSEDENLGQDTITEGTSDGTGDALRFGGFGHGVTVDLTDNSGVQQLHVSKLSLVLTNASTIESVTGSPHADHITAGAVAFSLMHGGWGDDTLVSGNGGFTLMYGDAGNDSLVGGTGYDAMSGDGGNDIIRDTITGDGADAMDGGTGDDYLEGVSGDSIEGGLGFDVIVGGPVDTDPSKGGLEDPLVLTFVSTPNTEVDRGDDLTLRFTAVGDMDGVVLNSTFYWDVDQDGVLDPAVDRLVGSDEIENGIDGTEVTLSTSGLPTGDVTFLARVMDNHGLFSATYSKTIQVNDPPPQVTQVLVSSSQWTEEFYEALSALSLGDGAYAIPVGSAAQLDTLPWGGIDRIHVVFSEDVVVGQDDLRLYGVNTSEYAVVAFSYDSTTFTATWTLDEALGNDKLLIDLDDAVTDIYGNHLDGEWTNSGEGTPSVFPSGDGTAGGDFQFRFNVLRADIDGSGTVDGWDRVAYVYARRGNYSWYSVTDARCDVDGNGIVDSADYWIALYSSGSLPSGEPEAP